MNLYEYLEKNPTIAALVGSLRGNNLTEIAFKSYCIGSLLSRFNSGDVLSVDQVMDLAEEFEVPLSEEQILRLLLDTGVLAKTGQSEFQIARAIPLREIFPRELRNYGGTVSIEAYKDARLLREGEKAESASIDDCISSIERTWAWALEIINYCRDHDLPGVPVFWPCEGSRHRPLGQAVGTMCSVDTLLLLLEPLRYGFSTSAHRSALSHPVLHSFLQIILAMQQTQPAWYRGAFTVSGPDDDFVGSFDEELGDIPPPTVDATADALLMLSLALRSKMWEGRASSESSTLESRVRSAIGSGIEFILRSQLETGAWGIHRFEGDKFPVRPRELSCKYVVEAMAEIKKAGQVSVDLAADMAVGIRRYLDWVKATALEKEDDARWLREFTNRDSSEAQSFYSTVWVTHSLITVLKAWPAYRSDLETLVAKAMRYVLRRWSPDREAFAVVELMVPTWRGMEDSAFPWELPADPMVVSLILDFFAASEASVDPSIRKRVDEAIHHFLAEERHGHWIDFLMKRDGDERAMPSNTYYYNVALLSYLRYAYSRLHACFNRDP